MKRAIIAAMLALAPAVACAHNSVTIPGGWCTISGKHSQKVECVNNLSSHFRTIYTQTRSGGLNTYSLSHLTISPGGNYLFFLAPGGATPSSGHIKRVNIHSEKVNFVATGSLECVVREGRYSGDVVVWQRVGYGGEDDPFLYSPNGHQIGLIEVPPKPSKCYRYGTNSITDGVYTGN